MGTDELLGLFKLFCLRFFQGVSYSLKEFLFSDKEAVKMNCHGYSGVGVYVHCPIPLLRGSSLRTTELTDNMSKITPNTAVKHLAGPHS